MLKYPYSIQNILVSATKTQDKNIEFLTLAEVKNYLRVDYTVDDSYIADLIEGAYDAFESYTNTSIRPYSIDAVWEQFGVSLDLPYPPINYGNYTFTVRTVEYAFEDGTKQDVTSIWEQVGGAIRVLKPETIAPGYRLFVSYTVANATIPSKLKMGLLKWVATNYEDRQNTADFNVYEVPNSSKHLWAEYRVMTL